MSATLPLDQGWLDWLAGGECLPWLRGQAFTILKQAQGLGLPADLWPYARPEAMAAGELDTAVEEIAHELWLFINAFVARRQGQLPAELALESGRPNLVGAYFRHGFLHQLRSQARRKDVSLHHYLYRRVRELVAQNQAFHHRTGPWGTLYSLEGEGESLHTLRGLIDTDYAAWPSPLALVEEKRLLRFRAEDLDGLARLFWQEASDRLQRSCFLPCRELVAFLSEHYQSLKAGPLTASSEEEAAAAEHGLADIQSHGLEVLASQLLVRWSPERRQVFSLALDPGNLTLQEVAERTGLGGPSHVKYHLNRACQDISSFCEGWPGASPSPADRGFWTEFLLCVAAACKNSLPDRLSDQR